VLGAQLAHRVEELALGQNQIMLPAARLDDHRGDLVTVLGKAFSSPAASL